MCLSARMKHRDSFNSRPHKEVDHFPCFSEYNSLFFQFTTSQGGRPKRSYFYANVEGFQFTTSQGGRLFDTVMDFFEKTFQFTTSQGGRPLKPAAEANSAVFQFTTSQGGRQLPDTMRKST